MRHRYPFQTLFLLIVGITFSAGCAGRSSPPGPSNMTGKIEGAGYTYHHWADGLQILMIHDTPGGFFCEGEGGTSSPIYLLECTADAMDGRTLPWKIETRDGQSADVVVAGEAFILDRDSVFLVHTTESGSEVRLIGRDLSGMAFENESVLNFIQSDEELMQFLQSIATP